MKIPKGYSDKNFNKQLSLKVKKNPFDPKPEAKSSEPGSDFTPEEKKVRFKNLANMLSKLKK